MTDTYAFIADGRLYVSSDEGDKSPRAIESSFAKQLIDRHQSIRQRNAWKYTGPSGRTSCSGALFAMEASYLPPVHVVGAGRGENGEIFYCVQSEGVAGFFTQGLTGNEERRLAHSNEMNLSCLDYCPTKQLAVCSLRNRGGSASIAIVDPKDGRPHAITEGDAIDLNPSWVPGGQKKIVYQSSGIGRDGAGIVRAYGPTEILSLDLDSGTQLTLASDPKMEFIHPKIDIHGSLYYIRRPYEPFRKISAWQNLKDIILFPYRIIRAVFGWMNIFSIRYGGKPIVSQGDMRARIPDAQRAILNGNIADACNDSGCETDCDTDSLAPKSFVLVQQPVMGGHVTLAEGVACYDIADDGTIVYSDGRRILRLKGAGESPQAISKGRHVTKVIALG